MIDYTKLDRQTPYDEQEARVAQWITDRTGIGAGTDPVGFVLAVLDLKIQEMQVLESKLASLELLLAESVRVCGRNNCNCPGSKRVKDRVDQHLEKFA